MKRRHFMQTLGALTGTALINRTDRIFPDTSKLKNGLKTTPDEETFWKIVREQFIFPKDYVYLNTGGIGAVPTLVLNKIKTGMNKEQIHPRPGHDHKQWLQIKSTCGGLLSPRCTKDELALVSTATEGINIIINGLPLKKGDEVITSSHEHPAVHVPLLNRMQRDGIRIRVFEPNLRDSLNNVERISGLINKHTRLIFISHVTCTTGQLFPLKEIGQLARSRDVWFAVDGAQAVGSMPMDIVDCNVDFYTFSGHKWTLGPKRTGVLYVRHALLDTLRPITMGAYSNGGYDIHKREMKLEPTAQRYEYATQNEMLFCGLEAGVAFVKTVGLEKIREHNKTLSEQYYTELKSIPGIKVISPDEEKYRTSMITFISGTHSTRKMANELSNRRGIRVRHVPEVGLEGLRVSFHVYNNANDVGRIIEELKSLI